MHWKWCCEACGSIVHYTAVNSAHLVSFATVSYFPVSISLCNTNNQPSTQVTQNVYEQQQSRNRRWLASFPSQGTNQCCPTSDNVNHISQVAFRPPNSAGVNVFSSVNNQFCWFFKLSWIFWLLIDHIKKISSYTYRWIRSSLLSRFLWISLSVLSFSPHLNVLPFVCPSISGWILFMLWVMYCYCVNICTQAFNKKVALVWLWIFTFLGIWLRKLLPNASLSDSASVTFRRNRDQNKVEMKDRSDVKSHPRHQRACSITDAAEALYTRPLLGGISTNLKFNLTWLLG